MPTSAASQLLMSFRGSNRKMEVKIVKRTLILMMVAFVALGAACLVWGCFPKAHAATRAVPRRELPGDDRERWVSTFEQLKRLEGEWVGKSSKGWEEHITFAVMASGSVVYEDSSPSKPKQRMMTMFYLDGPRLMLTHFCVSKIHPRLEATSLADEGREVTFEFIDAANLSSRDQGHMDKAVLRFINDDSFTERWTWYQKGHEQWLEEINYHRVKK